MPENNDNLKLVVEQAKLAAEPKAITVKRGTPNETTLIALADASGNVKLVDPKATLDAQREFPDRVTGVTRVDSLASFILLVRRFITPFTVLFTSLVTGQKPGEKPDAKLTAIIDYDEGDIVVSDEPRSDMPKPAQPVVARNRQHRVSYAFPLSEEWEFWSRADAFKGMTQGAFAESLEDRIVDVLDPAALPESASGIMRTMKELRIRPATRSQLADLIGGLKLRVDHSYEGKKNLDTGETQISWQEEIKGGDGAPLVIPNGFLLCIPVFRDGAPYIVPCRLRFVVSSADKKLKWTITPFRMDASFRDAVNDAVNVATHELRVPHYYGTPTEPVTKP